LSFGSIAQEIARVAGLMDQGFLPTAQALLFCFVFFSMSAVGSTLTPQIKEKTGHRPR